MELDNLEMYDLNLLGGEEGIEDLPMRAPKKYLRDYQNPFEMYSEWEFRRRFRFSKTSVMYGILPLIEEGLAKINNRGLPISPILQLLICLRFYATASFQMIVGPRTEILDIVPEWPGSEHDSRILQNSRIYMRYRQGELDGMLIGDAGYPALPFLLTPIGNPATDEEISYNALHGRTRRIVERTFGIWKRRFPCLSKGLSTKLSTSTSIVVACAVLHNLSLILNDKLDDNDEEIEYNNEVPVAEPQWQPGDGFLVRNALIERLFG